MERTWGTLGRVVAVIAATVASFIVLQPTAALAAAAPSTLRLSQPDGPMCPDPVMVGCWFPVVAGEPAAFSVTIDGLPSAAPTGTITIDDNGAISTIAVTGRVTTWLATLTWATHQVRVSYSGDANYLPSSGPQAYFIETLWQATPPAAPPGGATAINGAIRASWGQAAPNGRPVVAYSAAAVDTVTGRWTWQNVPADVRIVSMAGLVNGHAHDVYLMAWNATGQGPATVIRGVTPSTSGPLPSRPSRIVPTPVAQREGASPTTVDVTWGPTYDDNGSPVISYAVVAMQNGTVVAWQNKGVFDRATTLPGVAVGPATYVFVLPMNLVGYATDVIPALVADPATPGQLATTG